MTALSWINDLVQWLGRWVPRLVLIEPTHRGVLFGPRGSAREVGPGLVTYWPITHALVLVPITTQSVQLSAQVLPYVDDGALIPRVLLCAAAIQFRIERPVEATTNALHVLALVDNRSQAALARHIARRDDLVDWAQATLSDLRADMVPFGLVIERLDFIHHGTGVAIKNVSDWNYSDMANGTRPS